jgi:serine phosphatase RsbU (regulator of sigma subunit)
VSGAAPLPGRRILALVLVVALLGAGVVAAVLVWSAERADAERANEALARQTAAVAERVVELSAASLRGGEGLLRRSGPMPERGFRRFARELISETPFTSLAWAPRVPARERSGFERTLGRTISEPRAPTERNPSGDLRPVARRHGAYLPIRFVHPDEPGERRELGVDLLSEPTQGMAVRAARDTGRPEITTPLLLPGRAEPILIVVEPVYDAGIPLTSRRRRQLALAGILRGSMATRAIGAEIAQQLGSDVNVAIADGDVQVLEPQQGNAGGETTNVEVLGRDWTVWVEAAEAASALPALAVGAGGVALAALAAALFALAGRREQLLSRERDFAAAEAAAQHETSTALQQAFLPPSLPEIDGVESVAVYAPGTVGLEVGGDFYDLFATGDHWTAVIGDVSGKGAEAASLTALVRHTARAVADRGSEEAIREINDAVRAETRPGTFATMCLASLRPGPEGVEISLVVAGPPRPFILRVGGAVEPIPPTAPLVGVFEEIAVREVSAGLAPGDTLFLYTDGLTEARRRGGEELGEERLRAKLADAHDARPEDLIDAALARAREYSPDFPQDDVAILVLRATP